MASARPRSRWRAGVKAMVYLIAIGIIAGGVLVALGLLLVLAVGLFLGGGLLMVFLGLGTYLAWHSTSERRDPGGQAERTIPVARAALAGLT